MKSGHVACMGDVRNAYKEQNWITRAYRADSILLYINRALISYSIHLAMDKNGQIVVAWVLTLFGNKG
jgi:hypothetical protein